jgi:hypothetical protein
MPGVAAQSANVVVGVLCNFIANCDGCAQLAFEYAINILAFDKPMWDSYPCDLAAAGSHRLLKGQNAPRNVRGVSRLNVIDADDNSQGLRQNHL